MYLNFLAGVARVNRNDLEAQTDFGYSAGVYLGLQQVIFGLALETDGIITFKAGYNFKG